MPDLSDQIEDAAENPKKVDVDGTSVEAHSIPDLIEADKYLAGKTGAGKAHRGLRITKLIPGDAS